jgi:predicted nucleic acid-binding protein
VQDDLSGAVGSLLDMKVSVDASFLYALLKRELSPEEHERAQQVLVGSDPVHVAMVVVEELYRFVQSGPLDEETIARRAAIELFIATAETMPLTKPVAYELARLWHDARERGARSTTVDTLAAREAVHVGAVMLTCDDGMRRYLERGFGATTVRYFPHAQPR